MRASVVLIGLLWAAPAWAQTYVSIVGIPDPPFGVTETAPAEPASWTGTTSATAGYWYICPTCAGATDSGNTYGHPNTPRVTVPTSFAPTSGACYVRLKGIFTPSRTITFAGTESTPCWMRGTSGDRPEIRQEWFIGGTYVIMEHLYFSVENSSATVAGRLFMGNAATDDHLVIRHSESQAQGNIRKLGGIYVLSGEYNVAWNNHVHHLGDPDDDGDQDAHCMVAGGNGTANNQQYAWIVYNEMNNCSGDGLQINSGNGAGANDSAHHLYIGGNHAHDNKQAGLWVKTARDLIFSSNIVHGHHASSSSVGQCLGGQYGSQRAWWINNTVYDCDHGILFVSISGIGNGTHSYVVGNVIYDMTDRCIAYWPDTYANRFIVGNTCVGMPDGIKIEGNVGYAKIIGNLVMNASADEIDVDGNVATHGSTEAHHNLLQGTLSIKWSSSTYTSIAAWQAATVHGDDSINADPLLTNVAGKNFTLTASSPAIDAGVTDPGGVVATFNSLYSLNISQAIGGTVRPQGTTWDLGAYEYASGGGGGPPDTSGPKRLRVRGEVQE